MVWACSLITAFLSTLLSSRLSVLLVLLVMEKDMQAITTASVLALPLDMEEVTESSDSDEVGSLSLSLLCFGRKSTS